MVNSIQGSSLSLCLQQGDRCQQAEDLLQETFIAALKSFEQFRGQSTEKTWLTGILRHRVLDYYRKSSRQWRATDSVEGIEGSWFD